MTVVAVLAAPPRPAALPRVAGETPLSDEAVTTLYEAALSDAVRAVARSGGDLLVNYRAPEAGGDGSSEGDADADPAVGDDEDAGSETEAETAVQAVVEDALGDLDGDPHVGEPRYEPQVGSTAAGRVGNTVTHLLREEEASSAAVLWPTAPLVGRTEVDEAAMKLRSAAATLGPTTGGGVYYAGFTEPVEFADALAPPAVETLTERADEADFLGTQPTVATPSGLALTTALVRSRERADRRVPAYTAAAVETLGLRARGAEDGGLTVVVE